MESMIDKTTVIMPLGGLGTRARKYTKGRYSKFLIPLSRDLTVLDLIIQSLLEIGFKRYIFCIGTLFPGELVETILSYKSTFDSLGHSYQFSYERRLLGGAGAYYKAFSRIKVSNPVISIPGDIFLPWQSLPKLVQFHLDNNCDVTIGLTDFLTETTTDVEKIWIKRATSDIVKCLAREEHETNLDNNIVPLTSVGAYVINPQKFKDMYKMFIETRNEIKRTQVEMRDQLLPWLVQEKLFKVKGFNLKGEILDVGSYERIVYAKKNWRKYTMDKERG